MIATRSPPIPLLTGSMRPRTAFVAMAASIAFPPRSRICIPDIAAIGCVAATIPYFVVITERPETRGGLPPCGADALWASTATERTAKVVIRITSVFFICLEFLWKYISLDDDRDIPTGNSEVDRRRATISSAWVYAFLWRNDFVVGGRFLYLENLHPVSRDLIEADGHDVVLIDELG